MMQELPKQLKDFVDYINVNFKTFHSSMEFEKLKIPDIDNLFKNEKQLKTLTDCFTYKSDAFETLEVYATFIQKCNKHLPTLRKEIKDELAKLKVECGDTLKKIIYANQLIKKEREKSPAHNS
jgi:hypothetical protein